MEKNEKTNSEKQVELQISKKLIFKDDRGRQAKHKKDIIDTWRVT